MRETIIDLHKSQQKILEYNLKNKLKKIIQAT